MSKIDYKEISVVVQGPILGKSSDPAESRITYSCLKSIRETLPGAEIILSTWKGSDTTDLDYDNLIENEDPGAFKFNAGPMKILNVNRQIVSTLAGIKKASGKYTVKMRTDTVLKNNNFINYFSEYKKRSNRYKVFDERIITPTLVCHNPRKQIQLFQFTDTFAFGYTKDLLDLWDIPLARAEDINLKPDRHYEPVGSPLNLFNGVYPYDIFRCFPEQYIWTSCLDKRGKNPKLKNMWDTSPKKIIDSEAFLINNFLIIEQEKLGVQLPERLNCEKHHIYSFDEWQKLYEVYSNDKIPVKEKIKTILNVYKCKYKIKFQVTLYKPALRAIAGLLSRETKDRLKKIIWPEADSNLKNDSSKS